MKFRMVGFKISRYLNGTDEIPNFMMENKIRTFCRTIFNIVLDYKIQIVNECNNQIVKIDIEDFHH